MKTRVGLFIAGVLVASGFFVSFVSADRYTSTNYTIDANQIGASFGGDSTDADYQLTSTGGESLIGQGSGGSYTLGSGYTAQLQNSLQLSVQPNGLVAYYPFDENTGTQARDNSLNGNDAQLQSDTMWTTGKVGDGIDTTTDDAQVPDNADLPNGTYMTVELWAHQDAQSGDSTLVSHWDYAGGTPQSGAWALSVSPLSNTNLRFFLADSLTDAGNNYVETTTGAWSWNGPWHHIAVTFDGTQSAADRVKIYIDGAVQASSVTGSIASSIQDASAFLEVGDFYGLDRRFNGQVDELKLYDRALSANEIKAEYNAGVAGNRAGLAFGGDIVPGTSQTSLYDAIVSTDASAGYTLAISQDQDLTSGGYTIPAISAATIASPASWSEGTTKGLGFTLYGTNATSIDGKWNSGNDYAAFPATDTSFYTRSGPQSTKDVLNMRLRLDVGATQAAGTYTNVITTTGTITP